MISPPPPTHTHQSASACLPMPQAEAQNEVRTFPDSTSQLQCHGLQINHPSSLVISVTGQRNIPQLECRKVRSTTRFLMITFDSGSSTLKRTIANLYSGFGNSAVSRLHRETNAAYFKLTEAGSPVELNLILDRFYVEFQAV